MYRGLQVQMYQYKIGFMFNIRLKRFIESDLFII